MVDQRIVYPSIEAQAAEWYLLLQSELIPTERQLQEFLVWLQHPQAEQAYARCEALWTLSGSLINTPESNNTQAHQTPPSKWGRWWLTWQTYVCYSLQMSTLVAGITIFIMVTAPVDNVHIDRFQTAIGQQKKITLEDGSLLTLNTATAVLVSFQESIRKITLERGEALFDVAKDPSRPFVVVVNNGEIMALGTLFNVKKSKKNNRVEIALLEGNVVVNTRVAHENETLIKQQRLKANERISYDLNSMAAIEKMHDSDRITEWKEGVLSFTNTRLSEVVEQVNRYTVNKLIVKGDALQQEKINAYFTIGDTSALLFGLEQTLGIHWAYQQENIVLYRE